MYTLVLHCTQTGKVRVFPQHLFVCRVLLQFNKDLHLSMHVYTLAHTHRDTHRDTDRQTDRVNFLLFRYPFHPGVTAVAGERSRSFCQRCRWQVTATLACTLCMRLCMKQHDMVHDCMVYTECAEMAALSHGTHHATTKQHGKYTAVADMQKCAIKSYSHSFRITCDKNAVSLPRVENSAIQKQ